MMELYTWKNLRTENVHRSLSEATIYEIDTSDFEACEDDWIQFSINDDFRERVEIICKKGNETLVTPFPTMLSKALLTRGSL